jgi:hypothetical protein
MKEYLPLPKRAHSSPRGVGLQMLALIAVLWIVGRMAYVANTKPDMEPGNIGDEWNKPQTSGRTGPLAQADALANYPNPLLDMRHDRRRPLTAKQGVHGGAVPNNIHAFRHRFPFLGRSTPTIPSALVSVGMARSEPHGGAKVSLPVATTPPFWTLAALDEKTVPAYAGGDTNSLADDAGGGRFSLYAYLFYRPDAAAGAAATTYGGSQMFVRADWRLGNKGFARRSTLYARVSRDMTKGGRAEFAIGGAVQPFVAVPVTLHGERRVRTGGPDATAAFVSGGVSDVALPHGVVLNAYGQGGQVWPDRGQSSQFFDGQASLTKPVYSAGSWQLDAGTMAATGGQDSAARLDIGPVVTLSAGKGGAQLRGQVGWRFRIAGDAAPANGPAVTLSFGF